MMSFGVSKNFLPMGRMEGVTAVAPLNVTIKMVAIFHFHTLNFSDMKNNVYALFFIAIFQCLLSTNANQKFLLRSKHDSKLLNSLPVSCPVLNANLYYEPVIGILSHPGDGASGRLNNATNASHFPASYVKFVEAAGARVVPLIYNEPLEKLLKKLELVNGVLFTGGWVNSGLYFETVGRIFKKILEKNDGGDHFPLYAICLGFQLISMIISEDKNILEEFRAQNQASSLQFMENANINGTVFQRFPPDLLRKLSSDCLVSQNHRYGISPSKFLHYQKLSTFFEILTTCIDQDKKVYISTVRSRHYPVTGFQWHPEKNAFSWGSAGVPHTEDAIQTSQYVANFLVSEARKSINRPVAKEVLDNLIFNYSPTYVRKAGGGGYNEVYIFT